MIYEVFVYEIDKDMLEDLLLEEPFGFEILEKNGNIWKISTNKRIEGIEPLEFNRIIYEEFDFGELEPVREDVFVIMPSYAFPIKIKKGMAFGTGLHESTQIVLSLIKDFVGRFDSVLDVGCGSAILSIASRYFTKSYVKAIDIDPIAIKEAKENALNNGIKDIYFEVATPSDILNRYHLDKDTKKNYIKDDNFYDYFIGVYDVVLANLDMHIFEEEFKNLVKLFRKHLIISGIYKDEENSIKSMVKDFNLKILKQLTKNDWHGFVIGKG